MSEGEVVSNHAWGRVMVTFTSISLDKWPGAQPIRECRQET